MTGDATPPLSRAARAAIISGGLLAGLLLAWAVLQQVEMGAVLALLRGLPASLVLVLVTLEIGIHLAKAGRWRLLQAVRPVPSFRDAFAAQTIGCLANILFPLRTDDLARTAVLARRTGQPLLRVAGATLVDRLFDLASVGALALLVSPSLLARLTGLPPAGSTVLVLAGGGGVLLGLRWAGSERSPGAARGRGARMLADLSAAARALPRGPRLLTVLLLLLLEWSAMFGMFHLAASAFLDEVPLLLVGGMVLANYAAFLVPAAPGAVGVFEAAQLGILAGRPESPEVLAALVLLLHVNLLIPVAFLGLGFGAGELRRRPAGAGSAPGGDTTPTAPPAIVPAESAHDPPR